MTATRAPKDARSRDLARIHIGKKALELDDSEYRELLWEVAACLSSADLDADARKRVIVAMHGKGWVEDSHAKGKHPGRPRNTPDVPMLRKVEALLTDAKRPWEYARALAEKMFHVTKLEWLTPEQLHGLVSAMQIDANRRKLTRK